MDANVDADTLALLMEIQGVGGNKVAIAVDPQKRPKNLAADELVLYHPNTGTKIHFRTSGDLDINTVSGAQGNVNINTVNASVSNGGSTNERWYNFYTSIF